MRFTRDPNWNPLPDHKDVTAIAVDHEDNFYALHAGEQPFKKFDKEFNLISESLGGIFTNPHGLKIGRDGKAYITDNMDHTHRIFDKDNNLIRQIGSTNQPSDTGFVPWYGEVKQSAEPFNMPTNAHLMENGEFFVADGYGNARVHHFDKEGNLKLSFGAPGSGDGQMNLPHGITVDHQGRVLIGDRENSRILLFSQQGEYLGKWDNIHRPCSLYTDRKGRIYVTEFGYLTARVPGTEIPDGAPQARVSILDEDGQVIARIGGRAEGQDGYFFAPHDICVDSHGVVYVSEIATGVNVDWGPNPPQDVKALHRFLPDA